MLSGLIKKLFKHPLDDFTIVGYGLPSGFNHYGALCKVGTGLVLFKCRYFEFYLGGGYLSASIDYTFNRIDVHVVYTN